MGQCRLTGRGQPTKTFPSLCENLPIHIDCDAGSSPHLREERHRQPEARDAPQSRSTGKNASDTCRATCTCSLE